MLTEAITIHGMWTIKPFSRPYLVLQGRLLLRPKQTPLQPNSIPICTFGTYIKYITKYMYTYMYVYMYVSIYVYI